MKFIAHYIHRHKKQPDYWRTLYADDVNEATKKGEKMSRKGFVMVLVVENR